VERPHQLLSVLEDHDDETVVVSNVSEGYNDEDDIGMQGMPPTTQRQKSVRITKMITPVFLPNS